MTLPILLLIALALLQALDAWTTWRILSAGGRELNPAMRYAIEQAGIIPALVAKGAIVVALAWYFCLPYPWILGGLVVFYAGVVAFNLRSMLTPGCWARWRLSAQTWWRSIFWQ